MNAAQKLAWFNLTVVTLTLIVVIALWPFLGSGAFGGCGLLGLLGFGVLFGRRKRAEILGDERDVLINRRSISATYAVFWVVYVLAAAIVAPLIYGVQGAVPVLIVQGSVFASLVLVTFVMSIATLIQYARGNGHAA